MVMQSLKGALSDPGFNPGFNPGGSPGGIGVVILMVVNWSLEAVKWKYLIGKVEEVSFFKAFQGAGKAAFTGQSHAHSCPGIKIRGICLQDLVEDDKSLTVSI